MKASSSELIDCIQRRNFGSAYEALVDLRSGETVAYEALARFYGNDGALIDNVQVFDLLHDNPALFYATELELKRRQVINAPPGLLLFLNLDPHAFFVYDGKAEHPLFAVLEARKNIIIEIMENSSVSDARLSLSLAALFLERGYATAIDDIGHPDSLLSIDLLNTVQYFKFYKGYLNSLRDSRSRKLAETLLAYAREQNVRTIIEGIESEAQLRMATSMGFDIAQGYYFSDRTLIVAQPAADCAPN